MTKLTIKISKDVLRESANCNALEHNITKSCAIAVAVREIFPNVKVESSDIRGMNKRILLPGAAVDFIKKFDSATPEQRLQFPEFSFDIEIPDEVVDTISIDEIKRIVQGSKTLELV